MKAPSLHALGRTIEVAGKIGLTVAWGYFTLICYHAITSGAVDRLVSR